MTLREAASDLNAHLRGKFTNPLKPWFGVSIKTDSILVMFDKVKPCSYTEWQGYEVEYCDSGMPIMGTGADE